MIKPVFLEDVVAQSTMDSICEILVLPDGRIFAHNISPLLAEILAELDPADEAMKQRAGRVKKSSTAS